MKHAPISTDESYRLSELQTLDILNTPHVPRFGISLQGARLCSLRDVPGPSRSMGRKNARRPMTRTYGVWALPFALIATLSGMPLGAQEIPSPPYYVGKSEAVVIGIAYDESRVAPMAPPGIQMAPGATGVVIMYKAEDSYGLPPYSSSFIGLDVDGFDAPGGGKARWMLTGLYSPVTVNEALAKYFYYPVREGSTRVERDGRRVVAVGSVGGQEIIRTELVLKAEPCQRGSGMVHEVTRKSGAETLQLIKIPHAGEWCPAESVTVEISAPTDDPFGQLSPVKVLWGGYSNGGFGWSAPAIVR